MDKVWIITTKLEHGLDEIIEGVFDSYELAHMAAENIWHRYDLNEDGYLWKRGEVSDNDSCKMTIYYIHRKTLDGWFFATIRIEPYNVRH